jgi:hypothetical protein
MQQTEIESKYSKWQPEKRSGFILKGRRMPIINEVGGKVGCELSRGSRQYHPCLTQPINFYSISGCSGCSSAAGWLFEARSQARHAGNSGSKPVVMIVATEK